MMWPSAERFALSATAVLGTYETEASCVVSTHTHTDLTVCYVSLLFL